MSACHAHQTPPRRARAGRAASDSLRPGSGPAAAPAPRPRAGSSPSCPGGPSPCPAPACAPLSRPPLSFPPGRGAAWRSRAAARPPAAPLSPARGHRAPQTRPRPRRARRRTCPTARPLEHRAPLGPLRAPGPQHNPVLARPPSRYLLREHRTPDRDAAPGPPRVPGPRRALTAPGLSKRAARPGEGPRPRGSPLQRAEPCPKGTPGSGRDIQPRPKGSRHPASGARAAEEPLCPAGGCLPRRGGASQDGPPRPAGPAGCTPALAGPLLAALLATARARLQPRTEDSAGRPDR